MKSQVRDIFEGNVTENRSGTQNKLAPERFITFEMGYHQERPQQLPGPAQLEGGPPDPQHRSAAFWGTLPLELTAAWADNNFLRLLPPQLPQTTRSVSLLAINISVF